MELLNENTFCKPQGPHMCCDNDDNDRNLPLVWAEPYIPLTWSSVQLQLLDGTCGCREEMMNPSPPLSRTRLKHIIKATNMPENSGLLKLPRASKDHKPWPRMEQQCLQPRLWPVEPPESCKAQVSPELFPCPHSKFGF